MKPQPADRAPCIDVYARVSLDADLKQKSTSDQVRECTERLEELGYEPGVTHVDNSKSAWNERIHRPSWESLMQRLESGAAGGVIVFDLARFSRRPRDGERLIQAADRGLVVLDTESAYDLTTPNGKKTFREHLNSAAYESDRLSTRVRRGKKHKAGRGETNHSNRPFGFGCDGFTPLEPEAGYVREAVEWMLNGGSLIGLVRSFNTRGIKTTFDNAWSMMSMREMLKRPRNAGLIVYQGEVIGSRGDGYKPLVSEDSWRQVVSIFAARKRGRPLNDRYLGTGLLVCGKCGNRLYGKPNSTRHYPDGERERRYTCNTTNGGCGGTTMDWRQADAAIETLVLDMLTREELATAQREASEAMAAERARVQGRLDVLDANLLEIAARFGRGEMLLAEYDAITGPLRQSQHQLRLELDAMPVEAGVDAALTTKQMLASWRGGSIDDRRRVARRVLGNKMLLVQPVAADAPRKFDPRRIQLGMWEKPASKLTTRRP